MSSYGNPQSSRHLVRYLSYPRFIKCILCADPRTSFRLENLDWDGGMRVYFVNLPKWRNRQTRTTQNRVPSGMWVRFPPSAPKSPSNVGGALAYSPRSALPEFFSGFWQCSVCFYIAWLYNVDPGRAARWGLWAFPCESDSGWQIQGLCAGSLPSFWRNSCVRCQKCDSIDWVWLNGTSLFLSC